MYIDIGKSICFCEISQNNSITHKLINLINVYIEVRIQIYTVNEMKYIIDFFYRCKI